MSNMAPEGANPSISHCYPIHIPMKKPLITVNHFVSMVTSTDFGLLYYHYTSTSYNINIRVLYYSLVGFPSVKTWQPTNNMGWECSLSTEIFTRSQLQRIKRPGAGWNGTRVQVLWRFSHSSDRKSGRLGMFFPTMRGNIVVILDCPEEYRCFVVIFPKRGLEDNFADPKTTFFRFGVPC